MDIQKGFQIEDPNIFVPWCIDENTLCALFTGKALRHVTAGYYIISCRCLQAVNCLIGFHFEPRENGQLTTLEFSREAYDDLQWSYTDFQFYFQMFFGHPTASREGTEGYKEHLWIFDNIYIHHAVTDRQGEAEYMRISYQ